MSVTILIILISLFSAFMLGRWSKSQNDNKKKQPKVFEVITTVTVPNESTSNKATLRKALRQMETTIINSDYIDWNYNGVDKVDVKIKLTK